MTNKELIHERFNKLIDLISTYPLSDKTIQLLNELKYPEKPTKPKPMFEIGDRIAIYSTLYDEYRIEDVIIEIGAIYPIVYTKKCQWVHQKQCRKLKKKESK